MGYVKPYIDASGLHLPNYLDVRESLMEEMRGIFGEDIYLEEDSQDYQMISAFSDKISDLHHGVYLAYHNNNPATAIGEALDLSVKSNGIRRKGAGHSVVQLVLTGEAGTVIHNGLVGNGGEHLWKISGTLTIPESGALHAEAVCQDQGTIYAEPNTLTYIVTPTLGWKTVTNPDRALVGNNVESDGQLRARQAISVARPSRTVLLGIQGGILELPDVLRCKVYENDTNITDKNGIPEHSISAVVEGGDAKEIAQELYYRKTPGTGTYGDVEVIITDESSVYDVEVPPIQFFRPLYVEAHVEIHIEQKAGYVEQTTQNIVDNVAQYLSSLKIGHDLITSALYGPILSADKDITNPSFSVQSVLIGKDGSLSPNNIEIAFNEVTKGVADKIKVVME